MKTIIIKRAQDVPGQREMKDKDQGAGLRVE
jgi:hypothetical protein